MRGRNCLHNVLLGVGLSALSARWCAPSVAEENPHNESFSVPPELLDGTPYDPSTEQNPSQVPVRGVTTGTTEETYTDPSLAPQESTSLVPYAPQSAPPAREPRIFGAARENFSRALGPSNRSATLAPIPASAAGPAFGATSGFGEDTGIRPGFLDAVALPTEPAKVPAVIAEVLEREDAVEATKTAVRRERDAEAKRSTSSTRRLLRTVRRDR